MKARFTLYRRNGVYYCEDSLTHKQTSLRTREQSEATALLHAKNESVRQPALNLQIAKAYLAGSDSGATGRTWQHAIEVLTDTKCGANKERWLRVAKDRALVPLLPLIVVETKAEALLNTIKAGSVSTNVYLRRLHNICCWRGSHERY
jgi:hypothetical protein